MLMIRYHKIIPSTPIFVKSLRVNFIVITLCFFAPPHLTSPSLLYIVDIKREMNFSLSVSSSQQNCYRKNSNIFLLLYCALRRRWRKKICSTQKSFTSREKHFFFIPSICREQIFSRSFFHKFKLHKAPTILHNVQGNQESRGMKNEHLTNADTDVAMKRTATSSGAVRVSNAKGGNHCDGRKYEFTNLQIVLFWMEA